MCTLSEWLKLIKSHSLTTHSLAWAHSERENLKMIYCITGSELEMIFRWWQDVRASFANRFSRFVCFSSLLSISFYSPTYLVESLLVNSSL